MDFVQFIKDGRGGNSVMKWITAIGAGEGLYHLPFLSFKRYLGDINFMNFTSNYELEY